MIEDLTIKNYKSIVNTTLPLSRFTVLIGENGAGKSNILEALVLAAAAASDKLDLEYISARGVRLASCRLTKNAFDSKTKLKPISINICAENPVSDGATRTYKFILNFDDDTGVGRWTIDPRSDFPLFGRDSESLKLLRKTHNNSEAKKEYLEIVNAMQKAGLPQESKDSKNGTNEKRTFTFNINHPILLNLFGHYMEKFSFERFMVYSPSYDVLRNPVSEPHTSPVGPKGEGLLSALSAIQEHEPSRFKDITDSLELFGWYKAIHVPSKNDSSNDRLKLLISDKYIRSRGIELNSTSVNEGFLFVLFYLTIFCSSNTPRMFAIENIDSALNPRLCEVLVKHLVKLGAKYQKQAIVTTHNPATLDAINLDDDEQSLVIIRRNTEGHTQAYKYKKPIASKGESGIKLSEAFMRGHIGALPRGI